MKGRDDAPFGRKNVLDSFLRFRNSGSIELVAATECAAGLRLLSEA
jgi:hypothetical protein